MVYKRRYRRRRTYKRRTLRKRIYKRKTFRRAMKQYDYHKLATVDVLERIVGNPGTQGVETYVPWYYNANLSNFVYENDIMKSAMNNYEYYRPVGVKIEYQPAFGDRVEGLAYCWQVHDANSNLQSTPLTLDQAQQHKYHQFKKPGQKWKHYINLKKHAKSLGVDWISTETFLGQPQRVPSELVQGKSARPQAYSQLNWEAAFLISPGVTFPWGFINKTYYFEFKDRKVFEQEPDPV